MRDACSDLGSLAGLCVSPVYGVEAKTLPQNSFSHGSSPSFLFSSLFLLPLFFTLLLSPSRFLPPKHQFTNPPKAWQIGRSIALSRALKQDPISSLLASENGVLLFTGKIVAVKRIVGEGFTRGDVVLESSGSDGGEREKRTLKIEFENENLSAVLKREGEGEDVVLASCPDLITVGFSCFHPCWRIRRWG